MIDQQANDYNDDEYTSEPRYRSLTSNGDTMLGGKVAPSLRERCIFSQIPAMKHSSSFREAQANLKDMPGLPE